MILLLQELVKQRKSNPLLTLTIYRGIVSYGISSKIYFSVASKMNQRQMKSWGRLLTKGLANFSKVIEIFKSLVTHDDIPKSSDNLSVFDHFVGLTFGTVLLRMLWFHNEVLLYFTRTSTNIIQCYLDKLFSWYHGTSALFVLSYATSTHAPSHSHSNSQKQPFRSVIRKMCSENMH